MAMMEDSHDVSDVNHVAWCKLSPVKAAETLRRLEGGEEDNDDNDFDDHDKFRKEEEDPRWRGAQNMFASAGDDGLVKVWTLSSV